MCLAANATLVGSVIDDLVTKNEPFTAYDATRQARARGATEYHRDLKSEVHSRWLDLQNNGYTRSLVPTPTGDAWLYHPNGYNPQDYVDKINAGAAVGNSLPSPNVPSAVMAAIKPITAAAAVASLSAVVAAPTVATAGTVKNQYLDSEGRLPIYADQLAEIGCKPGGLVAVYLIDKNPKDPIDDGKKEIRLGNPSNQGSTTQYTYTVNADGRIRLSASLIEANLPPNKSIGVTHPYKVQTDGDEIVIQN